MPQNRVLDVGDKSILIVWPLASQVMSLPTAGLRDWVGHLDGGSVRVVGCGGEAVKW